MKINVFTYVFHPEKFLITGLCKKFAQKHMIQVSVGLPNYPKGKFLPGHSYLGPYYQNIDGIKVKRFPVIPRGSSKLGLLCNYASFIFFSVINLFRMSRGDCSFVFATSPIFTAIPAVIQKKLRGTPVVIWLQDLWPESFTAITGHSDKSLLTKTLKLLVKWIYRNTDVILIQSEGFRPHLQEMEYNGRVEWVPNWGETHVSSKIPDWLNQLPPDKFIVSFAGNIGVAQKLDTLLEAAALMETETSKVFFAIAGDGRERKRLETQYGHLENVKFFGQRPPEDMPAFFKKSSALLVMLKDDPVFSQTIPSKFQAYLPAAKPILTSLSGAGAELAKQHSLGPVTAPCDSAALKDAIIELSNAPIEEQHQYGQNALSLFNKEFNFDIVSRKIEQIIHQTSESSKGG